MSDPGNESLDEALREASRLEKEKVFFDEQFAVLLIPSFKKVGETFGTDKSYQLTINATPHANGSVTLWESCLIVLPDNSKA